MFDFGLTNEDQKQAIVATEGPVLIIAGPGTGKTFTLVKRIAYLVLEMNVSPSEIMVMTFTEKAARELITRISNEFIASNSEININDMYIGTFHSVCLRLLKENSEFIGKSDSKRMLDAFEQNYIVCRNIESFNHIHGFTKYFPESRGAWRQATEICRYVNQLMEELVDVDAMIIDQDEDIRLLGKLVEKYKELLERNNMMDFSSIQTEAYEMLERYPEVSEKIKSQIKYIMVDEYQDTNYIQEQIVLKIAGDNKNICVVGDDDQGMYRFRGATIRNILEFPEKFDKGKCTIIHLDKNYRSEPGIIDFYNNWMEGVEGINLFNWDRYRYEKRIVAAKSKTIPTRSVYYAGGSTIEEEKTDLLHMIESLKDNGNIYDYNQVAFLFKSVKSSEATQLGEFFEENGIQVYSPRSNMFFQRTEVKQILGCIMLCFSSYLRDLKGNNFNHHISNELRDYFISCVKEANVLFKTDNGIHDYISKQSNEISRVTKEIDFGLLDIMYKLISFEPFKTMLETDINDNVLKTRAARNLSEISRLIAKYNYLHDMHKINAAKKNAIAEEFFNIFIKYLYVDGIGEYEDKSEYAPKGCISFMTIHQSKGLEFPVVVVGSLGSSPRKNTDPLMMSVENRFFHRPPYEPLADIKFFDFWRLYYTAFSRAENLLVLATQKEDSKYFRNYLEQLPSIIMYDGQAKFETVKRIKYKNIYSFTSHISIYDGCPTQYKFYKEYSFAQNKMFHTSVGSLVHATLEDMNNCIIDGHLERVNEETINTWFELNYNSMQEQTGYYLTDEQKKNALMQVVRYYHNRKNELGRVWKAEEEINLVLPDYILQGIIDLVEGEGDTVEVVDYKTGPKPDVENHPERVEHYRKQLEIYAYLIEKKYKKNVSRMHLYYTSTLEGNPIISFDWSREAIDKTVDEINQTVKDIESKKFDRSVQNNYACEFCDMRYVCGKSKV